MFYKTGYIKKNVFSQGMYPFSRVRSSRYENCFREYFCAKRILSKQAVFFNLGRYETHILS